MRELTPASSSFSFDCETSPGNRLKHSFGIGGFDDQEEFDTSIKCSKCIAPVTHYDERPTVKAPVTVKAVPITTASPVMVQQDSSTEPGMNNRGQAVVTGISPQEGPMHVHFLAGAAAAQKAAEATVEKYGPSNCVETWRDDKTGHCHVQTKCKGVDTTKYMFGLICLDKDDTKTRHLFGVDSFDSEETFDTLIACKECLALDNYTKVTELEAENAELAAEVDSLATEVGTISKTFTTLKDDVKKLNEEVAKKEGEKGGGEEKKEEKKEGGEEKKEEAKKEEEAAKLFYLKDRDVDENLPYDDIAKSHLKDGASQVKRYRENQKKRRQRQQKQHKAEDDQAEEDEDDAEDEDAKPQRNFRKKAVEKAEGNDEVDDSSEDDADEN